METNPREDPAMRIATVSVDFKANLAVYLSLIVGAGGILFDFQSTPAELISSKWLPMAKTEKRWQAAALPNKTCS